MPNLEILDKLCFEKLVDNVPTYVFWKDHHSVYQGCNMLFAHLAGLDDTMKIKGLKDADLPWSTEHIRLYLEEDEQILSSKEPLLGKEIPLVDISKQEKIILVNKYPLLDSHNEAVGILGIFIDITAEKDAQRYRLEKEEALLKSKHIRIAAGTIAHDLRTPLAGIRLSMEATEQTLGTLINTYRLASAHQLKIESIDEVRLNLLEHVIQRCQKEIDFASNYIDLILGNLKYDAIDTSRYQNHRITEIVTDTLAAYPYKGDEKNWLHWESKTDFTFWGNDFYLRNVLNNLLKNSIYYIKEARRGEILIWTESLPSCNKLYFKDTAKGASPEVLAHIFDGYYSTREQGTGLGLAFCKSIMTSFGGDITVDSIVGKSIQFTLTFPVRDLS